MGFMERMDSLKGSVKDAAGDVMEFIDDKVDMPVIIGECCVVLYFFMSHLRPTGCFQLRIEREWNDFYFQHVVFTSHALFPNTNIRTDVKGIKEAGGAVHATSRETSKLCHSTINKASEVVSFGMEMKETLDGMTTDEGGGGIDASKFEIIKDLVDGDRIREATRLAGELGDLALQCVEKSRE